MIGQHSISDSPVCQLVGTAAVGGISLRDLVDLPENPTAHSLQRTLRQLPKWVWLKTDQEG